MEKREEIADQSLITLSASELEETRRVASFVAESGGQVLHLYGPRVMIGRVPPPAGGAVEERDEVVALTAEPVAEAPEPLTEAETLGLAAWNLRLSPEYDEAKAERPRGGLVWDSPGVMEAPDGPEAGQDGAPVAESQAGEARAPSPALESLSEYLIGSVAVGIVIVEGPEPSLQFSFEERAKVVAEVQEGLTWLASQEPRAGVSWSYDIRTIRINTSPDPGLPND